MELYIHIPFCRKKCRYCDFTSFAGCESLMPAYVDALIREAEASGYKGELSTIYMGGGTPSLLPAEELTRLFSGLRRCFSWTAETEFSAEANPGTLTPHWLAAAAEAGVNRISLGMQAKQPELLQTLGRIHSFEQVQEAVRMIRTAGIRSLNLDLMFGLPGQTLKDWQESLEAALELHPEHLSCYGLIPEDGTPLKQDLDTGRLELPDPELEREMYQLALNMASREGLIQYEISNFAKRGFECRHNIGYWTPVPWLGLGAGAVSMIRDPSGTFAWIRAANPGSLPAYLAGEKPQAESITWREAGFEMMMVGLRKTAGVSDREFECAVGQTVEERFGTAKLEKLLASGLLLHQDGAWRLSRRGMDLQNTLLIELMDDK